MKPLCAKKEKKKKNSGWTEGLEEGVAGTVEERVLICCDKRIDGYPFGQRRSRAREIGRQAAKGDSILSLRSVPVLNLLSALL